MSIAEVKYVSDEQGHLMSVIVPITLWQEILSELETNHLLNSESMKKRLLEARGRQEGIVLEEAFEKLGLK